MFDNVFLAFPARTVEAAVLTPSMHMALRLIMVSSCVYLTMMVIVMIHDGH